MNHNEETQLLYIWTQGTCYYNKCPVLGTNTGVKCDLNQKKQNTACMRGVVTSTSIHLGAIYVILVLMASINKLMAIPSIAFTNIKQSLKLV